MTRHFNSWLALGDSYTIGEALPLHESYPYQALQLLRKAGLHFHAPEIVAKTGWTTFELADHLLHHQFNDHYDLVTLLVGVNNQYRGLPLNDYTTDFEFLLKKALHYAGGNPDKVMVLSIPDWGVTPFAKEKEPLQIAKEIDAFNQAGQQLATQYGVHYIDITTGQRSRSGDAHHVAADQLHPSAKEYAHWANAVADKAISIFS